VIGRWAPVVLWMAIVFLVSSLSRLGRASRFPDWISHPIEYAVGSALFCRALGGGRQRPLGVGAAVAGTLLATLYGVTDEYHQSFVPGRTSDPADVAKDFVGAAASSFLYRRWTMVKTDSVSGDRPR
jgi:VanZ family protein